jgi:hypothetical protein
MTFMSPELLVPSKFGAKDSFPTPQGTYTLSDWSPSRYVSRIVGLDCYLDSPGPHR